MDEFVNEYLVKALNGTGIPFERDAWIDANNQLSEGDYGVVELTGSPVCIYGDDIMIEQSISGNVVLYVANESVEKAKKVQDVLKTLDIHFQLTSTEYLINEQKNRWIWRFSYDRCLF